MSNFNDAYLFAIEIPMKHIVACFNVIDVRTDGAKNTIKIVSYSTTAAIHFVSCCSQPVTEVPLQAHRIPYSAHGSITYYHELAPCAVSERIGYVQRSTMVNPHQYT